MGYLSQMFSRGRLQTPNANGPLSTAGGDPNGLVIDIPLTESRGLSIPPPSAWDGFPTGWQTPDWNSADAGITKLADIAWGCVDLNAQIIASMPVYQLRNGQIMDPEQWMSNPDPDIYTCWQEFARQLFWDYMMGEAFVLPFAYDSSTNKPSRFRVIPPYLIEVDMSQGKRWYKLGGQDVTNEILHIRYHSTTINPRGMGPLESAGARLTSLRLLQKYADKLAETGGVPLYWLGVERMITADEGEELLERWRESRIKHAAEPALVAGGATLNEAKMLDASEMAMLELSQFSESRICVLLGVPPFLVGLAGAAGSLTYSNIADLFDFHDRASLKPKTRMVMASLGNWALPAGRAVQVNADDYTRLPADKRALMYDTYLKNKVLTVEQVQFMERFNSGLAAQALTGSAANA